MSNASHWENIYKNKSPNEVSWTEEIPSTSIKFFKDFNIDKNSPIIDIGGGESKFVDFLLEEGYNNISILDISENALIKVKQRLGIKANKIKWIVSDINTFKPDTKYKIWHDRALFHFLTSKKEINRYIKNVSKYAENIIIGTFSKSGPNKCSGLQVTQYDQDSLENCFKKSSLSLLRSEYIDHNTPFNTIQNFIFCSFSSK